MISKYIKNLDIFSQPFQFNSSKQSLKKRTFVGAFLSITIILITLLYFIYLTLLYFSNQMDPKFRSQTFVTDEDVEIPLKNNNIAFQVQDINTKITLDQIQDKSGQTYLTFTAVRSYRNSTDYIPTQIDIIKCQDPSLKGFYCLDFSKNPEFASIKIGNKNNILSTLTLLVYRCQDTDVFKPKAPKNCANPIDIEKYINNLNNSFRFKLLTQQYNITSKENQVNYKNIFTFMSGAQIQLVGMQVQKQTTLVNDGLLVQSQNIYSAPISITASTQYLDYKTFVQMTNRKHFMQFTLLVDESAQYIQIQFPTFPEVLALCNSTLSLLMCLGILGKYMANKLIKQSLLITILQSYYLGTLEKILKVNQLYQSNEENKLIELTESKEIIESEDNQSPIQVRSIRINSRESVLSTLRDYQNNINPSQKDEIKEEDDIFLKNQQFQKDKFLYQNEHQPNLKNQCCQDQSEQINTFEMNSDRSEPMINLENKQQQDKQSLYQVQNTNSPIANLNIKQSKQNFIFNQALGVQNIKKKTIQNDKLSQQQKKLNKAHLDLKKIEANLKFVQSQTTAKKLEDVLFKFKLLNKKEYLKSKGLDPQILNCLNNQVDNSLDFLKFFKDLILVKKAMMMILTKDQMAALQLVKCSDEFLQQFCSQEQQTLNESSMNHFEEQIAVSLSEDYQINQIKLFLQKCQGQENLSEIDQRIYSSII
ncbi:AMP-binding enzyme family protein (macronuclear) [Tetrahymena thermophila SB210]|uniref:AMP-binding enzyme family protein n=1 Tax=Tetrahymena thermophila (strain SB210) TaxID=312017 RepID=Q23E84_TETTS|nr:AMP-binding enzyme family protein [Tetrahymena thermophila SB210]EAR94869.2 AMP-binding enzyme family protein [Tetrahymena thermophila SB210]|eukprot:XP_001015114.2 AMP-binding enzyme family protein [Tetrahymena thermophila SB210]